MFVSFLADVDLALRKQNKTKNKMEGKQALSFLFVESCFSAGSTLHSVHLYRFFSCFFSHVSFHVGHGQLLINIIFLNMHS